MSKITNTIAGLPINVMMFFAGVLHAMTEKQLHTIPDMNVDWWLGEHPKFRAQDNVGNIVRYPDLLIVQFDKFHRFNPDYDDICIIKALYRKMHMDNVVIDYIDMKLTAVFHFDRKNQTPDQIDRMQFLLTLPHDVIQDVINQCYMTKTFNENTEKTTQERKNKLYLFTPTLKSAVAYFGREVGECRVRRYSFEQYEDYKRADPNLFTGHFVDYWAAMALYEVELPPFNLTPTMYRLLHEYLHSFLEVIAVICDENNIRPIRILIIAKNNEERKFFEPYEFFKRHFDNEDVEELLNEAKKVKEQAMSAVQEAVPAQEAKPRLDPVRAVGPDEMHDMIHNSITQITSIINARLMDEPYLIANNCMSTSSRGTMYEIDLKDMGKLYPSVKQGLEGKFMGSGWSSVEYNSTTLKIALIDKRAEL